MRAKIVDHRDDEAVRARPTHFLDFQEFELISQHYYQHKDETYLQMLKRINWITVSVLFGTPLIALYGLLFVELTWNTFWFTVVYYFFTGIGITGGYHRMWSHKAYKAHWIVRLILMCGGTGAAQGSIRWWSRNHRIHHRYTDTPYDPYNARQGFLYAHMGWMFFTKDYSKIGTPKFDISDLEADPIVMFQNRNYAWLAPMWAIVVPTVIAGLGWGDWMGGYFFAGITRLVFVHHATFCVNSLAHWLGEQPFADDHTPKDHPVTALLSLGEGYHNFHHEFPYDYRNAIKWYQYDPTKWIILGLAKVGLAWDLKTFGTNEIQMGQWQMKQKKLDEQKSKLEWPADDSELERMDWFEFQGRTHNGEKLVVLDRYVLRLSEFLDDAPCGNLLNEYIGKDATEVFHHGAHVHSDVAKGIAAMKRVAIIDRLGVATPAKPKTH